MNSRSTPKALVVAVTAALLVGGCSTLQSAYDTTADTAKSVYESTVDTVSGWFQSDEKDSKQK